MLRIFMMMVAFFVLEGSAMSLRDDFKTRQAYQQALYRIGNYLPEEYMNVTQMIQYHGYPVEEHSVTTEDGYILGLQRIPRGRSGVKPNGQVVFLQHGLVASSTNFVTNSAEDSLGFILADLGYDVWLGNSRGNTYSKGHIKFSLDDNEFWDFSFDEMAKYDLPASIDYALKVSKQTELYYVGHSQGTTIAFAELSRNSELSKKVKMFVAMAPVATLKDIKGAIRVLSYVAPEVEFLFKLLGLKEFLPNLWLERLLARTLCATNPGAFVCSSFVFLLAGFDMANLNKTRVPVYLSHTPATTSVKDIVHWAQMARTTDFKMYDYGEKGNMKHYNQTTAPLYDVTNVKIPVALFTADKDWLADPYDVKRLEGMLPNIIFKKEIKSWNHLDFIWGIDAAKVIYKDIVTLFKKGA